MIEFYLCRTAVGLDFSFFAVLAMFFFFDSGGGLAALSACAVHELGHLAVMRLCNIPAERILFYGAGIRISAEIKGASFWKQLAVLSAGCAVNLLLSAAFYAAGELTLAAANLITGTFNLLCLGEFDGAQLARLFAVRFVGAARIDGFLNVLRGISAAVCLASALLLGGAISVSLLITLVYVLILMNGKC